MSVILSLSGGLDSAVLLALAHKEGHTTFPIFFNYGSLHNNIEQNCAQAIADYDFRPLRVMNIASCFEHIAHTSALTGQRELPQGKHYDDPSQKVTVVPGRNLIMLSILAGIAQAQDIKQVWFGAHKGDANIYPDCRYFFFRHLDSAVNMASEGKVELRIPMVRWSKQEVVAHGLQMKVRFEMTRTCYTSDPIACGRCAACQERLWAFKANGVEDPIEYQTRQLIGNPND